MNVTDGLLTELLSQIYVKHHIVIYDLKELDNK